MKNTKTQIIIRQSYFNSTYNILRKGQAGESLIASGFKNMQCAIDYARLYDFTSDFKPEYAFTDDEKRALQDICAYVDSQYCSWLSFVENVIHDSKGLSGLLDLIHAGKSAQEITNNYI